MESQCVRPCGSKGVCPPGILRSLAGSLQASSLLLLDLQTSLPFVNLLFLSEAKPLTLPADQDSSGVSTLM